MQEHHGGQVVSDCIRNLAKHDPVPASKQPSSMVPAVLWLGVRSLSEAMFIEQQAGLLSSPRLEFWP